MRKDGVNMSYRYTFIDGYVCFYTYKISRQELKYEEMHHGKCVSIVRV